jgi:hypothetical protein
MIMVVISFTMTCRHEEVREIIVLKETCTLGGIFDIICVECEETLESKTTSALGHKFGDYILEVAPSKNNNGLEVKYCSECNAMEEREYICPHETLKTKTTPSTCSSNGMHETFCVYCTTTTEFGLIDMLECTYGEWVIIKEPTCLERGIKERACSGCQAIEDAPIELVDCAYGDWVVTKKSTCTEYGSKQRVCAWCKSIDKESTPLASCNYKFSYSSYDESSRTITNYYKCVCGKTTSNTEKVYSDFSGVLRIDSVGLVVNTYNSYSQSVCDRQNSACYFSYGYGYRLRDVKIIGDHWNQGFDKIKKCRIGAIATLDDKTYKCVEVFTGHNNKTWLSDDDYNDITTHTGDLFMYTCNDHWSNITIVAWVRIS